VQNLALYISGGPIATITNLNIAIIQIGEYGVVYKGLLRRKTTDEVVAVKSLKGIILLY
jgi:hypothetical protein